MIKARVKVQLSPVHGLGVFAAEAIFKGCVIWEFTPGFDLVFTREQLLAKAGSIQDSILEFAWKSKKDGLYYYAVDEGKYFNHSEFWCNLSALPDAAGTLIAKRDIDLGEELTVNYKEYEEWTGEGVKSLGSFPL